MMMWILQGDAHMKKWDWEERMHTWLPKVSSCLEHHTCLRSGVLPARHSHASTVLEPNVRG